ncbi:MAG: hypothetical protein KA956_12560 [Pyrinomonadaceae bacterium]|nr:hypothetical protein [Acidobacteriota bacterium]MBP7377299.1 hypothetical protein [Pyrinomonadaceae bacterium]
MKQCPKCTAVYLDETLAFCLQDGTPLMDSNPSNSPTEVYTNTKLVTSVRPAQIADPRFMDSQVTRVGSLAGQPFPQPTDTKKSNTALAVGLTAGGMLLLFAIVSIGALLVYMNSGSAASNQPPKNMNGSNSLVTISPTPTSSPTATQTPLTPKPTPTSTPEATPTPPPERASYPATSRLKFARGAYTTSFSGQINPGDSRSLVLACRAGQSLSASITGGGSCISIRGGGSSMRTITGSGDNYISVSNRCSNLVKFSITITVI